MTAKATRDLMWMGSPIAKCFVHSIIAMRYTVTFISSACNSEFDMRANDKIFKNSLNSYVYILNQDIYISTVSL